MRVGGEARRQEVRAWRAITTYLLRFVPGAGTVMRSLTVVSGRRTVSLIGTKCPVFASRPTVRVVAIFGPFSKKRDMKKDYAVGIC